MAASSGDKRSRPDDFEGEDDWIEYLIRTRRLRVQDDERKLARDVARALDMVPDGKMIQAEKMCRVVGVPTSKEPRVQMICDALSGRLDDAMPTPPVWLEWREPGRYVKAPHHLLHAIPEEVFGELVQYLGEQDLDEVGAVDRKVRSTLAASHRDLRAWQPMETLILEGEWRTIYKALTRNVAGNRPSTNASAVNASNRYAEFFQEMCLTFLTNRRWEEKATTPPTEDELRCYRWCIEHHEITEPTPMHLSAMLRRMCDGGDTTVYARWMALCAPVVEDTSRAWWNLACIMGDPRIFTAYRGPPIPTGDSFAKALELGSDDLCAWLAERHPGDIAGWLQLWRVRDQLRLVIDTFNLARTRRLYDMLHFTASDCNAPGGFWDCVVCAELGMARWLLATFSRRDLDLGQRTIKNILYYALHNEDPGYRTPEIRAEVVAFVQSLLD